MIINVSQNPFFMSPCVQVAAAARQTDCQLESGTAVRNSCKGRSHESHPQKFSLDQSVGHTASSASRLTGEVSITKLCQLILHVMAGKQNCGNCQVHHDYNSDPSGKGLAKAKGKLLLFLLFDIKA